MGLDQVVEHSLILVLEESVKNLMFKRFQGGLFSTYIKEGGGGGGGGQWWAMPTPTF
jgi:hypothetical protein